MAFRAVTTGREVRHHFLKKFWENSVFVYHSIPVLQKSNLIYSNIQIRRRSIIIKDERMMAPSLLCNPLSCAASSSQHPQGSPRPGLLNTWRELEWFDAILRPASTRELGSCFKVTPPVPTFKLQFSRWRYKRSKLQNVMSIKSTTSFVSLSN